MTNTCDTCAGYEHCEDDRLAICLQQHSPDYMCAVLKTHSCWLWSQYNIQSQIKKKETNSGR